MTLPPRTAYAQQFVCSRIDPGDSAASLALRMTGDAANRFAPWFQILDPITQRFVPKSQYGVLLARWRACLSAQLPGTAVSRVQSPASAAASKPRPGILQAAAFDVGFASRVGVGVWLLLLSLLLMDGYLAATRPVPDNLRPTSLGCADQSAAPIRARSPAARNSDRAERRTAIPESFRSPAKLRIRRSARVAVAG